MSFRLVIALLCSLIGTAFAFADEFVHPQQWSIGGAALASSDSSRITIWSNDALSAGVAPTAAYTASAGFGIPDLQTGGMQAGGFLAWQSSIYRVDATLSPSFDGQMSADVGASVGAMPGQGGTRYGLRIGTAWTQADHFTLNPTSGLGLTELTAPYNNVSVSFLVNHALTPNLNLIGMAEAQHSFGSSPLDGSSGLGRLVVGAGLGYKF